MRRTSEKPLEWRPDEARPEDARRRPTMVAARQDRVALDGADREAREVVVAAGIDARHLRRLAADQGAAGLPAALGDALDDRDAMLGRKLAGGEIVEEEQAARRPARRDR